MRPRRSQEAGLPGAKFSRRRRGRGNPPVREPGPKDRRTGGSRFERLYFRSAALIASISAASASIFALAALSSAFVASSLPLAASSFAEVLVS